MQIGAQINVNSNGLSMTIRLKLRQLCEVFHGIF